MVSLKTFRADHARSKLENDDGRLESKSMYTSKYRTFLNAVPQMQAAIKIARFTQLDKKDSNRYQHARDMLQRAEVEVRKHIKDIEETLAEHDLKGMALKTETALHNENEPQNKDQDLTVELKGKGKARLNPEDDAPEDEEEKGLPQTLAGDEYRSKRLAIKQRFREGLLLLHKVNFLQGDVHHILGNSAEEDKAYQVAEELRRRLLKGKGLHILLLSVIQNVFIQARKRRPRRQYTYSTQPRRGKI